MLNYIVPAAIIALFLGSFFIAKYRYKKYRKRKEAALKQGRKVNILVYGGKQAVKIDFCDYKKRTFVSDGVEYSMKRIVF